MCKTPACLENNTDQNYSPFDIYKLYVRHGITHEPRISEQIFKTNSSPKWPQTWATFAQKSLVDYRGRISDILYLDDSSFLAKMDDIYIFRKKTGHVNFYRNENFLTSFKVNETRNLMPDLPISAVSKIEHRQFSTFHVHPHHKRTGDQFWSWTGRATIFW